MRCARLHYQFHTLHSDELGTTTEKQEARSATAVDAVFVLLVQEKETHIYIRMDGQIIEAEEMEREKCRNSSLISHHLSPFVIFCSIFTSNAYTFLIVSRNVAHIISIFSIG